MRFMMTQPKLLKDAKGMMYTRRNGSHDEDGEGKGIGAELRRRKEGTTDEIKQVQSSGTNAGMDVPDPLKEFIKFNWLLQKWIGEYGSRTQLESLLKTILLYASSKSIYSYSVYHTSAIEHCDCTRYLPRRNAPDLPKYRVL